MVLLTLVAGALPLPRAAVAAAGADPAPAAGRLPRSVVPTFVSLDLRIDPAQPRFSGTVAIDVDVAKSTRTIWMHAGRQLEIDEAHVTPAGRAPQTLRVAPADASGLLRLSAPTPVPGGRARIELRWSAPFGELQGAYRVRSNGDDYVLTQMQPLGGRTVMPAFDEPAFKQPWRVSLTIPQALVGVSNTAVRSTEPAGDGWKRLVFEPTAALPSYLLAFAVGPWDLVDAEPLAPNAVRTRPVPLRGIAPRGQGPKLQWMLQSTHALVAALEDYFGLPYPYDKLDLLAAPDFGAGAMENAGLIVYRDTLLYADADSPVGLRHAAYDTHAHELAHQWFGDLVTLAWWDDTWLNEAFATWMAAKVVGQLQPDWHPDRAMMEGALRAMNRDSLASTRRIREPVVDANDVESAFDDITYDKGGAVLAMVEQTMGAERFRNGIRQYLRRHAGGTARSDDLIDALARASAAPAQVRATFDSFLNRPGVPIVHAAVDCRGARPLLRLSQQRYRPAGSAAPDRGHWQIPLCVRWGDAAGQAHTQCTSLDRAAAALPLQAAACPAWVMPNAAGAGYYRFVLAPPDAARLEAHLDRLDEREQRAVADAVDAAFGAGALDAAGFLRAAARLAQSPQRETVIAPLRWIAWMRLHLADTPQKVDALRDFVRRTYAPRLAALGTTPRAADSDDDRRLRADLIDALASLGRDPALRAALAAQGRRALGLAVDGHPGDGLWHADAVPVDQRALALRIAMEDGDPEVFDALVGFVARTKEPEERSDLLAAAGAATQPALRERARELTLAPDRVRRNEVWPLLMGSWRDVSQRADVAPALRDAARTWIDAHFDALAERVAPYGAGLARAYAEGQCSAAEADATAARLRDRMGTIEAGARRLAQTVEQVRLCGALRDRQRRLGGLDASTATAGAAQPPARSRAAAPRAGG